ncbi:MAG: AAA family ATPase [Rhizobiaceae bacterium]|nr:AAA family ATPase [Rhizobiaceae bacterium]
MMRLRKLDLARFGHFTDQSIDFGDRHAKGSDFHIVYGANEAGKTTTMEGYLRLLYGFPARDPYGFKHQRANLCVGGTLEINDADHGLTRLSTRNANLLDATGDVVPETLLQSALGGLSMEDYRKLLCLDDETIEVGGEEITKSKGDIGRLLFSAAAGVSDLSEILDKVEEMTLAIYRKGGSKSLFAELKRQHDQVSREIRDHDVSASDYRGLRDARDRAGETEAELRQQKKTLSLTRVQLEAIIKAHPLARALCDTEAELEPIAHYPDALDIDPETLVNMLSRRVGLVAARDRAAKELEALEEKRQTLVPRPGALAWAKPLDALKVLKSRVETAQFDLPKRQAQMADELKEMARRLSDLGIDVADDPTRFVLGEAQLAALELHRNLLLDAERTLETDRKEAQAAAEKFEEASKAQRTVEAAASVGPELSALMARYNGDLLLEKVTAARQELALNNRQLTSKLQGLTRLDKTFDDVPLLAVTAAQAKALAGQIVKAEEKRTLSQDQLVAMEKKWGEAKRVVEVSSALPELISDAAAAETRRQRDAFWAAHRAALVDETADRFETAMHADDDKRSIREGQAREIADHRQAIRAEIEARQDFETASKAHEDAKAQAARLHEQLVDLLQTCALPESLMADELSHWVQQVEDAQQTKAICAAIHDEHAPLFQRASDLKDALAKELGEPDAELEALVAMARVRMAQYDEEQRNIKMAEADLVREAAEVERREARLAQSEAKRSAARQAWDVYIAQHLPDVTAQIDLLDALPTLRALREINERKTGVRRQIEGMEHDLALFEAGIGALGFIEDVSAESDPLAVFAACEAEVSAALRIETDLAALVSRIQSEKDDLEASDAALQAIDAQVRDLAAGFDPEIKTATLEDLREAVKTATRAIDLRAKAKVMTQELLSVLNMTTRQQAEAALAAMTGQQAAADLQEIDTEISRVEQALDKAIEERTAAGLALNAVIGDSDIAALTARKRTIEAEMEAALLKYLEGRFGHMLADRAIRRYRDSHRSGMMAATEKAFSDLTNGAYGALTTQPGAGAEMLMAIQASDQVAKEASAMSKGTRFQLYLALRAAAYEQMASNGTVLPFFCDDVFETFDEQRTRAACGLMHRIGQTGQAIYLTHHQHVVDIAREVCGEEVSIHAL